tara:strand:- start:3813 stop:4223 length:411 start_codon:yes stop_codon:yes gene_type:complete
MAYKGYKGCGPKKLGASPMKQTVAQNDARRDAVRDKIAKSRGKDLIGSDARLGKGHGVIGAINAGVKNFRENTMTPEGRSKFGKNIAKDVSRLTSGVKDMFKSTHQHHSDNRFKKKNTSKVINQGKSNEKLRTKIN